MFFTAATATLIIMVLALMRAFIGPTLFDRIVAVNMFATKTVLLVAVISVAAGDGSYLDIALVYTLINFIGVIAVLRFFEYQKPAERRERG